MKRYWNVISNWLRNFLRKNSIEPQLKLTQTKEPMSRPTYRQKFSAQIDAERKNKKITKKTFSRKFQEAAKSLTTHRSDWENIFQFPCYLLAHAIEKSFNWVKSFRETSQFARIPENGSALISQLNAGRMAFRCRFPNSINGKNHREKFP